MPWRYFYSTFESDAALKSLLAGQDFLKSDGVVAGVNEYRALMESEQDFRVLVNNIHLRNIRAIASRERLTQFGSLLPDNYFDTTQFAPNCNSRVQDTLENVIGYLKAFGSGTIFAQRDLDIQGSTVLGTVDLTLSSLYTKKYNIPINGTVSDRTLIMSVRDSTAPSQTQSNAVCNSATFDYYANRAEQYFSVANQGWNNASDSNANALLKLNDSTLKTRTAKYEISGYGSQKAYLVLGFQNSMYRTAFVMFDYASEIGQSFIRIHISNSSNPEDGSKVLKKEIAGNGSLGTTIIDGAEVSGIFQYVIIEAFPNYATSARVDLYLRDGWAHP